MKKIIILFQIFLLTVACKNNNSENHLESQDDSLSKSQQASDFEREEFVKDSIKKALNNTWTICYGSSQGSGILDIAPTFDKGCVFTSFANIQINDGLQIKEKRIYKLQKIDSLGKYEWGKIIADCWRGCLSTVGKNNYFLTNDRTFQIYDNKGNLKIEKDCNMGLDFHFNQAIETKESDLLLVGEINRKGIIIKLNRNLEIIQQHIFGDRAVQNSVFDYDDGGGFSEVSKILSITQSSTGFYFTGQKSQKLWVGKVNEKLEVVWEKNDYNFEQNGNGPKLGNTILVSNEGKLIVSSQYSNSRTDLNSIVIKIDEEGKVIWEKKFKGQTSENENNLIQHNEEIYLTTFDSKENTSNKLYSRLFTLKQNGELVKESTLNLSGNNILVLKIIDNSEKTFFALGTSESNKNKGYVFKCNNNCEVGENFNDYSEVENDNSLDINLDFRDKLKLSKFLRIYDFHCSIKNGYTAVMSFNTSNEEGNGKVTFTMLQIKKTGGFDFVSSRIYTYSIDESKSNDRLYFNTNMQGEIYLEKNGTLIMNDISRNERYIFYYSKK
ncbi:MAG: hypothetical protein ACOYOR_05510 [Flavobacterium psychrophilum]